MTIIQLVNHLQNIFRVLLRHVHALIAHNLWPTRDLEMWATNQRAEESRGPAIRTVNPRSEVCAVVA